MKKSRIIYTFILYLFGFFLLLEWMLPVPIITQTGELRYFNLFIAISLILYFFQFPWWLRIPIKFGIILYFLYRIFGGGLLRDHSWMQILISDLMDGMKSLLVGDWYDLSDLSRSLLLFILLWLMTYLLRYWLMIRKSIFIFYVMTIIYIAVLDTFTGYVGDWAMVRIVAIGFALLGLLFFQRLLGKEQFENRPYIIIKWAFPLVIMITVSVCLGYLLPKADPIWPDPVPFIQSTAENVQSQSSISTIGYGPDDSQLGGPFEGNDRVVFEVETPSKQYWKVEIKDYYTGKGWISTIEPDSGFRMESGEVFPVEIASRKDEPIKEAIVDVKLAYPHIVRPYAFLSVKGNEQGYFQYNGSLDKITSYSDDDQPVQLEEYIVQYKNTAFSMKEMRKTTMVPNEQQYDDLFKYFTQLPESLPDRVRELADEITAEHDNWYDQAIAIENYFQSGDFIYDQKNVAIPEEDQDYVDQFLFETFRGYCDNYSTSMVTLLRAVDIPARWVKGYTAGNYIGNAAQENSIYQVTNNEAHSWVEVYFPTEGWVPFEPTKGFDNFASYEQDEEKTEVEPVQPKKEENKVEAPKIKEQKETKKDEPKKYRNSISIWPKLKAFSAENWFIFVVLLIVIIVGCVWMVWNKSRWIPYVLIKLYKKKNNEDIFVHAYNDLLRQLNRFGIKREPGQTLREYALEIDKHFDTNDMTRLTEYYERMIYRGDPADEDWEHLQDIWESLLRKTTKKLS
ncbi:transglutaminase TgpA family protein [Lederbergia lenta]|uniref:Transglutaminase-like enzymes, cysteine protease YebA n=1 Tax=Lederbergia lenta TaxID=1467 RepID=A0A2X4VR18_LEDLE|nr:transglutaminaseTgpA domain-containing protein [Lederbergia lenta]MEC2325971.1 transglutaminaseTgpA domain-containing protein [Lederbergia lenta]SQI53423.1 transglutaminase-like enzymes, cysteine protease YebA [Lederbergia lenta]